MLLGHVNLWYNKHTLVEKKAVFNKKLKMKGIVTVNDVLSEKGGFVKIEEHITQGFTYSLIIHTFFYKNPIYKNHEAQISEILRIV